MTRKDKDAGKTKKDTPSEARGRHSAKDDKDKSSKHHKNHRRKDRLNKDLDINDLWLCVPKKCKMLSKEDLPEASSKECFLGGPIGLERWKKRRESLRQKCDKDHVLLYGQDAIDHAKKVHEKIHRRALRFSYVHAVDIGFAVLERNKTFENALAIRLHVNKKLDPDELKRLGLPDMTDCRWDPNFREHLEDKLKKQFSDDAADIDPLYALAKSLQAPGSQFLLGSGSPRQHPLAGYEDIEYRPTVNNLTQESLTNPDGETPPKIKECCAESEEPNGDVGSSEDKKECRVHICGVPLDMIQAEYFPTSGIFVEPLQTSQEMRGEEPLLTGRDRINTLVGGVSIGNEAGQAGTLGAVAWDRTDGTPCLLSNYHVLSGTLPSSVGQRCYQPALFDGGSQDDVVANLKRWFLDEDGDMGIAELRTNRPYASGEILGMWHPIAGTQKPELNLVIRKFGRTTGFSRGFIDGIHLATNVDYGNGVVRFFKNQIHIAPLFRDQQISQVGDSGALVLTSKRLDCMERRLKEYTAALQQLSEVIRILERDPKLCAQGRKPSEYVNMILTILCKLQESCKQDHEKTRDHDCHGCNIRSACELLLNRSEEEEIHQSETKNETLDATIKREAIKTLKSQLREIGFDVTKAVNKKQQGRYRQRRRVYYAVGMLFAGDTAGSPFGEFALASDIEKVVEKLQISLQPVFEPRSSFRRLRQDPEDLRAGRTFRQRLEPGDERSDDRGTGPQPDPDPLTSGGQG
ncbi:MAG: hypothetical protein SX243_01715 [Acidobacteriota bacterium]|nr:hypothetical protein [Acidobacteriota bacterium]